MYTSIKVSLTFIQIIILQQQKFDCQECSEPSAPSSSIFVLYNYLGVHSPAFMSKIVPSHRAPSETTPA